MTPGLASKAAAMGELMTLAGTIGCSITVDEDGVHLVGADGRTGDHLGSTLPEAAERLRRRLDGNGADGRVPS